MRPSIQNLQSYSGPSVLVCELVLRVTILLITIVMQLSIKPHMYCISEIDLLNYYKYPRRRSYVSPLATVFIIVIIPLLFFIPSYLTRNFVEIIQFFLAWSLALSVNALVTESIKLATGRPRPDYFYRCFPDGVMTKELTCTGELKDILEGRKSFPSGHSSFAFCSMGFVSLWLWRRASGPRSLAAPGPLLVAAAVAASRCYDNHHHVEDVIFGSLLGFLATFLCYKRYCSSFLSELSARNSYHHLQSSSTSSTHNRSIFSILQTPSVRQM